MSDLPQRAPPVLSTPETHIFEDPTPLVTPARGAGHRLSDEELCAVYEVARTAREVRRGGWRRVALQFPDAMLGDAVRVFEALERDLERLSRAKATDTDADADTVTDGGKKRDDAGEGFKGRTLETSFDALSTTASMGGVDGREEKHRLYILGDTSYGACCVDEIAAEHVDAEVVVHYGRSCLSPTARLPVIYVFTSHNLPLSPVIDVFEDTYGAQRKQDRIILVADIGYHSHVMELKGELERRGYTNILAPEVVHDPSSVIPNRRVEGLGAAEVKEYSLFHISDPPPALLLTLSSRVKEMFIYPTTNSYDSKVPTKALQTNTAMALRRRYGRLTSLSTCAIFGILINTLSVRNYLETVTMIKKMIEKAGKKSYTFVVGKVNAAKIANFSEIGGWVVVGCWESSLIESTEFYRPIITPFELSLALKADSERVWSGEWRGDFESLEAEIGDEMQEGHHGNAELEEGVDQGVLEGDGGDLDSEEESAPPEFDFRTGRYVSQSRPMRTTITSTPSSTTASQHSGRSDHTSTVLTRKVKGDLATVNGTASPGAEYLRSQRTWTGLGSDFHEVDASQTIEEGRSGVARGYTVGEGEERR